MPAAPPPDPAFQPSSRGAAPADGQSPRSASLQRRFTWRIFVERVIHTLLFLCAFLCIVTTIGITYVLLAETVIPHIGAAAPEEKYGYSERSFFQEVSTREFFTGTSWTPQFLDKAFGVLPLVGGTLLVALIAAIIGLPLGILSAVYLSEYADRRTRAIVKPVLELLAGVPTVVYGYFALVIITPWLIQPLCRLLGLDVDSYNALSGGIVVGIMVMPMVCSLSEDALRAVPRSLREAGYALGSTKYDISARVVLPAAFSGIVASFLLAMARAVGETMAVAMACGNTPRLTANPLRSIQTMTSYIVAISTGDAPAGTIEYKSLYAVGLCLFLMTFVMNIVSDWVMRRYREVYH